MATSPDHAGSAAPPQHLKVWSDGKSIYVEIPGIAGKVPYIATYSFDSRGVGLVLSLLGLHRVDYDYKGTIPSSYTGTHFDQSGSDRQHAQAEALLRRLSLIK